MHWIYLNQRVCAAVLLTVTATAIYLGSASLKPECHEGKPVAAWVQACLAAEAPSDDATLAALKEIGPPVVELLMRRIERKERRFEQWYRLMNPRLPSRIRSLLPNPVDVPAERRRAVELLGELNCLAEPAVPLLSDLLRGSEPQLRDNAIRTLGQIGPEAVKAVPALCRLLHNLSLRALAAATLGEIGPGATRAVPELISCLEDSRFFVRWHTAQALWKIDRSQSRHIVPVLTEGLNHPILESHRSSRTLAEIGPEASSAVCALIEALGKPDKYDRAKAAEALGRIGPPARAAAGTLERVLTDAEPYVRAHAAEALFRIDPDRRDLEFTLQRDLHSPDCYTRFVAARGLWEIRSDKESLLPHITNLMQSPSPAIRAGAANLLHSSRP